MAFVLEKISEEDINRYGAQLKKAGTTSHYHNRWAIDRQKDMFLIHFGGCGMSDVSNYELHCGNEVVKVSTERKLDNQKTFDTAFVIQRIEIPLSLQSRVEEIKSAISEALTKYGYCGDLKGESGIVTINLNDSSIHFTSQPKFLFGNLTKSNSN
ncbi:MAG: hypothetical protein FJ368_06770 [Pelagibacterales bacterium]|nr:hypothetical protein [Pelagibacterales bacterium]